MATNNENTTPKEMGLIKHLSRRNFQLEASQNYVNDLYKNALQMIYELGGDVFDYAEKCGSVGKAYGMSVINQYHNKKGERKADAHYNKNGYYIGSIKTLGNEPIPALYQTKICKELFVYDPVQNDFVAKKIETQIKIEK
jgi:hypothetical protein